MRAEFQLTKQVYTQKKQVNLGKMWCGICL